MVRLTPTVALALLTLINLPALILADSEPPCVAKCISANPTPSLCNGDETGSALDDCTCKSYESAPALISCINACAAAQANAFASNIPTECRGTLFPKFPGVNAGGSAAALGSTSSASATSSGSSTSGTTAASASATKDVASSSSSGAAATQAVMERNVVAGGLAALGLVAAFAV